jgi:dipeptide/tripeptide permease
VTPLLGAYLADSHWGRYKTILVFSTIYLLGCVALTASSAVPGLTPGARVSACVGGGGGVCVWGGGGGMGRPVGRARQQQSTRQHYARGSIMRRTNRTPGPDDDVASWLQSCALFGALGIIALGTGGIKPNVSAFGADQFDEALPQDAREKESFFNWFYLAINVGRCG